MRPLLVLIAALFACEPTATEGAVTGDTATATATNSATAAPSASAQPASDKGVPCGELGCMQFDSAAAAFKTALAGSPVIIALGEAHAQKGTEHLESTTVRFAKELLPLLKGNTSDVVVELMIPDPKCKEATAKVEKNVEKPVTKTQRKDNKSTYQKMAEQAKEMGIRPHVLRPSCDQLKSVAKAGDEGVLVMLELIASLSDDLTQKILDRNKRTDVDKRIALYGGAMHNDIKPRKGRELWSFGPKLAKHVDGRYVEIDLIIPEYIKDNAVWNALPWVKHYDRAKHGDKVTMFEQSPGSFIIVFAASS